jgi:hypothetical protein
MEKFPEKWLSIIGKHLRKRLDIAADAPLPEHIVRGLEQLRASEIARLSATATAT